MSQEFVSKHIRLTQTHIDILDEIIKTTSGISNYADAVRYTILSSEDPVKINSSSKDVQRKINAMAKSIDIITEMVAGGFNAQDVRAIGKAEDSYIYQDAERTVEDDIQRATTIKSNIKSSNLLKDVPREEKETKKYSRNFI